MCKGLRSLNLERASFDQRLSSRRTPKILQAIRAEVSALDRATVFRPPDPLGTELLPVTLCLLHAAASLAIKLFQTLNLRASCGGFLQAGEKFGLSAVRRDDERYSAVFSH
jgi:hypothetical protein